MCAPNIGNIVPSENNQMTCKCLIFNILSNPLLKSLTIPNFHPRSKWYTIIPDIRIYLAMLCDVVQRPNNIIQHNLKYVIGEARRHQKSNKNEIIFKYFVIPGYILLHLVISCHFWPSLAISSYIWLIWLFFVISGYIKLTLLIFCYIQLSQALMGFLRLSQAVSECHGLSESDLDLG